MAYTRAWSQLCTRFYIAALSLILLSSWSEALSISYCSPDNVGGTNELTNSFMSNGKCQDNCQGSYVFAVIQGTNCWCSNYAPSNQVDTGSCNTPCPGYPYELCGNPDQGLFGYFSLGGTPSGTEGASSSSPSRTSSPSVSTSSAGYSSEPARSSRRASSFSVPVSLLTSVVSTQSAAQPSSSSLSSSTVSETDSSALPSSPNPTNSPSVTSPLVVTSVISVTGKASTILITSTPAHATDSALGQSSQTPQNNGGGLKSGTVAGIVVGVAIVIGLVIGGIVFFWLRRRHRRNLEAASEGGSFVASSQEPRGNGAIPSRQVSQMSSAGLLTRPSRANNGGFSLGERNGNGTHSDRNSSHMTVDQRLNPWAIYSNEVSRHSNVSLQDNQDYSRQLRVANPDP